MLKAQSRSGGQPGTSVLLEAMSKGKVHADRSVLDAESVESKSKGAQTQLISSILLPDGDTCSKFVALLLQRGADVNRQDRDGRTVLSHACEKGHLEAVKVLVRNNADPEIVDTWGNTALMYATVEGHSHVVEFLVRAFKRLGLQTDRQNKVGNSAVKVAEFLGHTRCISALTSASGRGRERSAQPRLGDKFESKVELLQTSNPRFGKNYLWHQDARLKQRPSMGSIEETENDGSSSPPRGLVFSGVLTPKPPLRSKQVKGGPQLHVSTDHLPALGQKSENSALLSPADRAPSTLGILLTPILCRKSWTDAENPQTSDYTVRRFHDSYYQKRCSLPASLLSPATPERAALSSRKPRRRQASPCRAETHQFTTQAAASSATTFSALSDKIFKLRFTSPEFKKEVEEDGEVSVYASGRMPRSETFPPQDTRHPQVDSKRSIDSISSVKCEFDFHSRMPKS